MPAPKTGSIGCHKGKFYARVLVSSGKRIAVQLPACATEDVARARSLVLKDLADQLTAASITTNEDPRIQEHVRACLEEAGKATTTRALDAVRAHVADICRTGIEAPAPQKPTLRFIGEQWTSGELADKHRDHIRVKSSSGEDAYRLEKYVYPVSVLDSSRFVCAGDLHIDAFTLDHAEAIMRACPLTAPGSRRQVAQVVHRLLAMAVYPLRLRPDNPLPKGWMPKPGEEKALQWLYPDEDARLLACVTVPLRYRVLYGFLSREGMRRSEAYALQWRDVDLVRGTIILDVNKTRKPRSWALNPSVVTALKAWRGVTGGKDDDHVFINRGERPMNDEHLAVTFRVHLGAAGVTRAELFTRTEQRLPIRAHDLRATFVTLALARGKTEAWVKDRTGHTTTEMIDRYRRAARTAEELHMPELTPMAEAIPEFRAKRVRVVG